MKRSVIRFKSAFVTALFFAAFGAFCTFSTIRGQDDFFGPETSAETPAETLAAVSETPAAPEPQTAAAEQPNTGVSNETAALESLIPSDSLLVFRTIRLKRLNEKGRYLFEKAGLGKLSPTEWLKLASFGKVVGALDMERSAAVCYLPAPPPAAPAVVVFLPVSDFGAFVSALGGEPVTSDTSGVPVPVALKKPLGWSAFAWRGFAVLYETASGNILTQVTSGEPFDPNRYTPSGLKHPDFTLEVSERGVRVFANLTHAAVNDFLPVICEALRGMDVWESAASETAFGLSERADELLRQTGANLRSARFDAMIGRDGIVTATVLRPYPETPLARQIADTGGPYTPTSLDGPGFLKILPDERSPISGQVDLAPESAARLEKPFDRIRHVEYSFALPKEGELLAESWCFFLEVDDSAAFIQELIVPKAQLIGSHIGSEKLGELGAKILGNLAARRQARGRRPLLGTPEEAAARGEEIGASLGSSIGSAVGEQEAMKIYDFEGKQLLISDLALYTQKMKEIKAQERGERTRPPILLDGEPTLRLLIGQVLSGLESGSLEGMIQNQFGLPSNVSSGDLLLARRNLILVLDEAHLLIVPGNESVLRDALKQWRLYVQNQENAPFDPSDFGQWRGNWDALCLEMNDPAAQILRSANRIDLAAAQKTADFARRYYVPNLPAVFPKPLPDTLATALAVSTTGPETALFYSAVPNEILAVLVDQFLKNKKVSK